MSEPQISTAIPKRRYQLGEFSITVLAEIESPEPIDYRYILAVAREGEPKPGLYVCAERAEGSLAMRVTMPDGSQVIGASDRWRDLDAFTEDALKVVTRLLDLTDEFPVRLM